MKKNLQRLIATVALWLVNQYKQQGLRLLKIKLAKLILTNAEMIRQLSAVMILGLSAICVMSLGFVVWLIGALTIFARKVYPNWQWEDSMLLGGAICFLIPFCVVVYCFRSRLWMRKLMENSTIGPLLEEGLSLAKKNNHDQ